jgi:DNA-directed RNA polymerase specialized sigma24 family protein
MSMNEEFNLNEWLDYSQKVAKSFARSFPGIEWEDIHQEMAILLIEKGEEIAAAATKDAYIKKALQNVSYNYCMRERDASLFFSDQYDYRPDTVRSLLVQYYGGDVKSLFVPDDARSVRGDDNLAMYGDVSRAVEMLPESHQKALERKYADGLEADTPAERKALSRAVIRLTRVLNENKVKAEREYNGPVVKRKVVVAA